MSQRETASDHTPYYVTLDEKEREQFLSDLGTFPPDERELFHHLCRIWEPEIPYARASGGAGTPGAQNELDRLMHKLHESGYGLVRTQGHGDERRKAFVLLTNQWDERFSAAVVEEELSHLLEPGRGDFPTEANIIDSGIAVPGKFVRPIDFDLLAAIYVDPSKAPGTILRVTGLGGTSHLFTTGTTHQFVQAAIDRVKNDCLLSGPLETISRLRDSSLSDTKHTLFAKDPVAWSRLTGLILDKREQIDAKKNVSLSDSFYEACYVVREFARSQLLQVREQKKASEERRLDFAAIAQAVHEHKPPLLTKDELGAAVLRVKSKYGEEFEDFSREFYDMVLAVGHKGRMPIIVRLGENYIHRDLMFGQFKEHLADAAAVLREEYIGRMAYQLRHGSRSTDQAFLSRDNFEADIEERLYAIDPFLWEVLQNPTLFAECLIHGLKQEQGVASIQDIRRNLANYVDVPDGEFLPLSHLLDLNMVTIFEHAFLRVPVLRQLFIRIAGRYEAYKEKYVGRTMQKPGKVRYSFRDTDDQLSDPAGVGRLSTQNRTRQPAHPGEERTPGMRRPGTNPHRKSASAGNGPKKSSHIYTQRERDAAWDAFNDLLNK